MQDTVQQNVFVFVQDFFFLFAAECDNFPAPRKHFEKYVMISMRLHDEHVTGSVLPACLSALPCPLI